MGLIVVYFQKAYEILIANNDIIMTSHFVHDPVFINSRETFLASLYHMCFAYTSLRYTFFCINILYIFVH